ncbi:MAG: site-specific tyrosine recombinase XerC [Verrucomicrobiota bacterium]
MAGKKGFEATERLRNRSADQRGGNPANRPPDDLGELARLVEEYLNFITVKGYSINTVDNRRDSLKIFLQWAHDRDITEIRIFTKPILENYQSYLWHWKKKNGQPLGVTTQRNRLSTLKDFFVYLSKQNHILANPASELELPRPEKRLPKPCPTKQEVERILSVPDISDPLGVRDRAMLELLYSTGIRRSELTKLKITDINRERGTLQIHLGKGNKDRVVPVGDRALQWIENYLTNVRPRLLLNHTEKAMFLTSYGEAFNPDVLSRIVSKFIKAADIGKTGSCHLLRHSCATHMLEGGADIRFIQQLLGHEKLETTAIYTRVSIEQLKAVHSRTHPAEAQK